MCPESVVCHHASKLIDLHILFIFNHMVLPRRKLATERFRSLFDINDA